LEAWAVDILGWGFSDLGTPHPVHHVIWFGYCTWLVSLLYLVRF